MISSTEFAAYNRAVARIGDKAASDVESSVLAWCRANASASVAEKREAAKLIMDGYIQGYDDIAAEFAAEWYDHRAQKSGVALDQAITMTTYKPESVDDVARYQAKKLAKGGDAEFAKACGEFARNDAFQSLNETIIANVGRDRDKGARFARVPTGFETCTFCLMLASRGAVYHTRKSAGEFKHFHRGCDCKVVPSFERDPMATLIEGHDPWVARRTYKRIESSTVFERDLHDLSINEIADQVDVFNNEIPRLWHEQKIRHDYVGVFERFVKEHEGEGLITCQHMAKPEGKELQLVSWLSNKGHDIEFLTPSGREGDHTPDIRLDGELWEIKRVTSKNPTKAKSRISDGFRQSDSVIVDLSVNENAAAIEMAAIKMLEDPRAKRVMVIRAGTATVYSK